jgi:hypothetical protein
MFLSSRKVATLLAAAVVVVPAGTAVAKPKGPSKATVKRILKKAYCAPSKNASGQSVQTVTVAWNTVKIGKRRVGHYLTDGVPANKKTYVFPIKADYLCDFTYTNNVTSYKAADKHITGQYVFFRDEFGDWTQRNKNHQVETVPGNN